MTISTIFQLPKQTPFLLGALVPGAKAQFYAAGTTTPQSVYTTSALSVAHANPVEADASGEFPVIYLDASLSYRVQIKTSADVLIYDQDDINDSDSEATAAEAASSLTIVNDQYPPGHVWRYGILPNDVGLRTANTTILTALLDPSIAGYTGEVIFPGLLGSDIYYFDDMIDVRRGVNLDLGGCTLEFAKSYEAADNLRGFLNIIGPNRIENGTIDVNYDGSAGTNAGSVLRVGSRNGYPFGSYGAGIDDEDLTVPMGNLVFENLTLTSNNPGNRAILALGGIDNLDLNNILVDGQDELIHGLYYEFGFYHYEATVANRTTSHCTNVNIRNMVVKDLDDAVTTSMGVEMRGAVSASIDGLNVDTAGGICTFSAGEAMYYNMGAPNANQSPHINIKGLVGTNLSGVGVNLSGSTDYTGTYLSTEGLTPSQETDLCSYSLESFSIDSPSAGIILSAPGSIRRGSITNATAEGIRIDSECIDFHIDGVRILGGATSGIRGSFAGSTRFATEREKVGVIENCFIAGNGTQGILLDDTISVKVRYNRIGYATAQDGQAETTQDQGILLSADATGVICEGNEIYTNSSTAYQSTGGPRDCMIINPRGEVTVSGQFGVDGVHGAETATNIADAAHAVNTTNKYLYKRVWDSSNNRVMIALGTGTTSGWRISDGSATVTPS